jgi:hypothetical protein
MRSSQRWLFWILLAALVLLLLVAVVSGAIYLSMRQPQAVETGWRDPVAAIMPEEILPGLALYPLVGASELDTIDESIKISELETAYAAQVFGLEPADTQRIGRLLVLGARLAESERPERATLTYQQVYDIAVLSPSLNDPARADALLAAGKGMAALGQDDEAGIAYDQVFVIAESSPYLPPARRLELFDQLAAAYDGLGDLERAEASRSKIAEWDGLPASSPATMPLRSPDLTVGQERVSSPEIGALEETRRQAAGVIVQTLSQGGEPDPGWLDSLAQALRAEDAAKLALYRQELEGTAQLGRRLGVHLQLIEWLTIKYQVATRGYGLSLIPEWEAEVGDIRSALSKAYEDLYFDYEDSVTALPDASLMGPGSYQVRRRVILSGRLGQYPNYPAEQLAEKLHDAVSSLIGAGHVEPLYVDMVSEDTGLRFFLTPASGVGQPTQSP